jgi:hypothetical protein
MEVSMNLKKACFLSLLIACVLAALAYGRKHYTTLTWDRSASTDVVGYNVYRGDDRGKENPLPVAKLVASECCKKATRKCKWEDFDVVPQAKHCYVIKSVLKSGEVLDLASNETCAVTP